jgi:hypothetical protein
VLPLQEITLFAAATCAAKHLLHSHLMTVAQGKILYETGTNIYGNCPALAPGPVYMHDYDANLPDATFLQPPVRKSQQPITITEHAV